MSWQQAVERGVHALGYEMVDAERSAGGLLRVFIDRVTGRTYEAGPGEAVTVDDCERVTRHLQYALDVDGVDYTRLEVSSPGLDRPLTRPAHFQRVQGQTVAIELVEATEGRRRFKGRLLAAGDTHVELDQDGSAVRIAYTEIERSHLVYDPVGGRR